MQEIKLQGQEVVAVAGRQKGRLVFKLLDRLSKNDSQRVLADLKQRSQEATKEIEEIYGFACEKFGEAPIQRHLLHDRLADDPPPN